MKKLIQFKSADQVNWKISEEFDHVYFTITFKREISYL